jgi:hypothetical protein
LGYTVPNLGDLLWFAVVGTWELLEQIRAKMPERDTQMDGIADGRFPSYWPLTLTVHEDRHAAKPDTPAYFSETQRVTQPKLFKYVWHARNVSTV